MEQSKETLLIVDDSRLQRAVLNEIFSPAFNILEVSSGEECLQMIKDKKNMIDLVLLDLVMQGMDGFDVLKHRQEMPEFKQIPVVVLPTTDTPEVQTKAFELGASDFLSKPTEPAIARHRIGYYLKIELQIELYFLHKIEVWWIKSEVDEMTHLLNKATAEHAISHILLSTPEELHALFAIDIDNFKAVNDIFGHKMGDHTISVVAGILASHFSGSDIIGRIGGDEFVAFMRDIASRQAVYEKAQELLDAILDKEALSIPENVTISIGIAFTEPYETSYTTLFQKADTALGNSKKSGKQCFSEYGVSAQKPDTAMKNILLYTHSRNVASTLKFAYSYPDRLIKVSSVTEIRYASMDKNNHVPAVFIDVSETGDDGRQLWDELSHESWAPSTPIIAICKEGNLTQIRNAILSDLINDLIFEPIDVESIKRRIKKHQTLQKNNGQMLLIIHLTIVFLSSGFFI